METLETVKIEGVVRSNVGSKYANALRKEMKVPCVFYGTESGNIHFEVHVNALKDVIYTPHFKKIALKVDGKEYTAILKDVQFHPVTDAITHVDFIELVPKKKIKAEIPIKTIGNAPGVVSGGVLTLKRRKLKVAALPKDLKSEIEVDVSSLKLGETLKVRDVQVENIELLDPGHITIAGVVVPRALKGKTDAEEAVEEEAEAAK